MKQPIQSDKKFSRLLVRRSAWLPLSSHTTRCRDRVLRRWSNHCIPKKAGTFLWYLDDPKLVQKYALFENIKFVNKHRPNVWMFFAINFFYGPDIICLDGSRFVHLGVRSLPYGLKQLILFSNRIIVYDFYHILISHHRIKLLLFLIVLRASEPHLSLLKRLIYYIKLSSRCQKINNLFRWNLLIYFRLYKLIIYLKWLYDNSSSQKSIY